ncbi:hypothetical protein G9F31_15415 [Acinetobacter sp. 187]|uniref:hypothetical protein n=1 Tax=Acinetobacter lanii TaxID=2715163 RepID=UPI001409FA3B|nr:hypothetical protein [Acinetobacter lanii]NHC05114.1 hypothetical protein [Acinetobacter lanii]
MKILKLKLVLVSIFILVSCTNNKVTEDGKYFKKITYKYFRDYEPYENISIDKVENKYSIVKISKSKLSLSDYSKVDGRLKKDGWVMISNQDNFYEYCLGEKLYIGAIYPTKEKYYSLIGNEVKPSDKDKWSIYLMYNEGKTNHCRNDKLPILELNELD